MSDLRRISKITLRIACQCLWLAALVVGLSGMYLLVNFRQTGLLFHNIYLILPAIVALISAAVLLASGGIGCWMSIRDSTVLQAAFVYLLVIVFCLEATASVLSYVNIGKVHSEFEPFWGMFQNYTGDKQDFNSNAVDAIQEEFQCCGVHNYSDWFGTPWFNRTGKIQVPHSCCNITFDTCNGTLDRPGLLYPQGCQAKLEGGWMFVLYFIIISSAVVAVIQVVGLVTAAQLMRDQPLQEYRILDRDSVN
ncbi:tetraspanin 37 [Paramormyrops kingsleyae]|uniref:tetraspanin 37 n=1 Tax=Paramormyrops kingsleyae TaxID=1676925 RepID=UPI003B96C9EF